MISEYVEILDEILEIAADKNLGDISQYTNQIWEIKDELRKVQEADKAIKHAAKYHNDFECKKYLENYNVLQESQ